MTKLQDKTGAPVRVSLAETAEGQIPRYEIFVRESEEAPRAGMTMFIPARSEDADERIFFHTEVDEQFEGRGLASILVSEAVRDSAAHGAVIVPLCPVVAGFLAKHGDDAEQWGVKARRPHPADIKLVRSVIDGAGEAGEDLAGDADR